MDTSAHKHVASIVTSEDDSEDLLVTEVGPKHYRLEESSVLSEHRYHDIVEVTREPDGRLRLLRVASLSGLKVSEWMISKVIFDSAPFVDFLARVVAVGGNWESIFGGLLILHLPPAQEGSMLSELRDLIGC